MKQLLRIAISLLAAVVLCAPMAMADSLQFTGSSLSGGGTFTFPVGSDQHLDVSQALINQLLTSTGACSTGCAVTGGYLNLDSGGQVSYSSGVYTFAEGGELEIFGSISSLGVNSVTNLLSASFAAGQTLQFSGTTGTFRGLLDPNSIVLNSALTSQAPVSGTDTESEFKVSFDSSTGLYTGKIAQSTVLVTTPEPTSLSLFGSGVLALAGFCRRRARRSA